MNDPATLAAFADRERDPGATMVGVLAGTA